MAYRGGPFCDRDEYEGSYISLLIGYVAVYIGVDRGGRREWQLKQDVYGLWGLVRHGIYREYDVATSGSFGRFLIFGRIRT